MLMGLFTSGIVYYQGKYINDNHSKLYELTLKNNEVKNLETLTTQWLTTLDLFLVNRQTYLYEGMRQEALTINRINSFLKAPENIIIDERIKQTIAICHNLQLTADINNDDIWQEAIQETDKITINIDQPIIALKRNIKKEINRIDQKIFTQKSIQKISIYILLVIIVFFTFFMLRWACKNIVNPIQKLTSLTQKVDIDSSDFNLDGPKEIKQLSKQTGNYILALLKAKEVALEESVKSRYATLRFKNIMETAGDAIVCTDKDGQILEMNQSFRSIINIHRNDDASFNLNDYIPCFELNLIEDDSSCKLISMIEATLYDFKNNAIPVEVSTSSFDSNGKTLFTIIIRDISDRAELTEKLLQAQKLESIGLLAAGIAHEINTPAQYIMDYNRFIKEGFESISKFLKRVHGLNIKELENEADEMSLEFYEEEIPNAINGSLYGLEQISRIVKSVKGFTHPEQCDKTYFNINQIIQDTVNVSRNEWKYDAEINLALDEHLPSMKCFPVRLNQVFLNLIINAAQAIQEKNKSLNKTEKGSINISSMEMNGEIVVTVSDSGNGIPDNIRTKIFDPFFTTKEVGIGTGQGLALAYDFIVKKHHGKIDVKSMVGEGTEFIINIPIEDLVAKAS